MALLTAGFRGGDEPHSPIRQKAKAQAGAGITRYAKVTGQTQF